jgi:hypothetical protein
MLLQVDQVVNANGTVMGAIQEPTLQANKVPCDKQFYFDNVHPNGGLQKSSVSAWMIIMHVCTHFCCET